MKTLFTNWREQDQKNKKPDVPLFDVPEHLIKRTIKIADRPLSETPTIVEIPTDQVSSYLTKNFGRAPFTWCENLMGPASFKNTNATKTPDQQVEAFFNESNISDALVLCFINEKVGFGLFALQDIPKNTLIGFYAGTLQQDYLRSDPTDYYR
ncbi:SET domain-containing protein [Legionella rowbothamii]|uniref:SET domain-containing protein n=1 Tax=Legionella rowbothamii TaxID=96229 RepID=UPI00105495CF|nr:SET domain-containing protein [Legionella rowbothamii]